MRAINADALEKTLRDWIRDHWTEAFTGDDAGSEFADMIEHAETIDANPTVHAHWIPASEKLPEYDKPVLLSTAWGKTEIGFLTQRGWMIVACSYREFEQGAVVAWMPLPEPYRAERRTDE